jgi:hypothetical protein
MTISAWLLGLTATSALVAGGAVAQDGRKHLTLSGIASGTVAPNGLAFASLSGTNRSPAGRTDGSLALGFGLGSAEDSVGLQVVAQITSLTDAFGDSGYLQFKLSRRLGAQPLYLGVQADHLVAWGDSEQVDPSGKLALTYFTDVQAGGDRFPVMMTIGAGSRVRDLGTEPGLFAGVGMGLTDRIGASVAFSGDYFDVGVGVKLNDQLSMTASVNDVFDQRDRQRVTISVTYAMQNLFGG